jgi:hypothetical protein
VWAHQQGNKFGQILTIWALGFCRKLNENYMISAKFLANFFTGRIVCIKFDKIWFGHRLGEKNMEPILRFYLCNA